MHLFLATRGMKWHRDRFVEQLSNLWVPMKLKDKKGNEGEKAVQVLLQPIEMWSLVFPEECLQQMLRTLEPLDKLGLDGTAAPSPARRWTLDILRKGMGLKKIPKWDLNDGNKFLVYKDNMQITGIGIKEDYRNKYGNECL